MADLKNITYAGDSHKEWTNIFVKVVDYLSIYYTLFLVIFGFVCNSLSFIVLSRRSFRSSNLSLQLRFLCVSDIGNLVNMFLTVFLQKAYYVDITSNKIVCHLSYFYRHVPLFISSWILVIVTSERVVAIQKPHRLHILCSQGVVKGVLAATVIIICLISLLPAVSFGETVVMETTRNTSIVLHCQSVVKDKAFNLGLMVMIITVFALLPSSFLVVLNTFIVVGVVKSRKAVMRKANVRPGLSRDDTSHTTTSSVSKDSNPSARNRISRREASLTKTVLAINITFILCTFPPCVLNLTPQFISGEMGVLGLAANDIALMLMYSNNAMNFVLYCVTGTKFRSEVRALFHEIIQCRCPMWRTGWRL